MANKHVNLDSLFTSIADAIREQSGNTEQIIADNFPEEIKQLKGKGEDVTEELAEQDNIIALMQEAIGNKTAGAAEPFAFITVTYPEGSICTCTDGTKTLTAKNTDGTYVFCVPYAATWTVTRTDPEDSIKTKSQIVEIVEEGQFENVNLAILVLFDGGAIQSLSVGNKVTTAPTVDSVISYDVSGSATSWSCGSILTDERIDLTEYKTLCVYVSERIIHNSYADGFILVDNDRNTQVYNYGNIPNNFISVGELLVTGVNSLDISELNTSYYIGVGFANNCKFEITKIWLE